MEFAATLCAHALPLLVTLDNFVTLSSGERDYLPITVTMHRALTVGRPAPETLRKPVKAQTRVGASLPAVQSC